MDGAGDQFLARAGFSVDEHRGIRGSHLLHLQQNSPDGLGLADDLLIGLLDLDLVAQVVILRLKPVRQLFDLGERFLDPLIGPLALQGVSEHVPQEAESLHEQVGPDPLDPVGGEGDQTFHRSPHAQGNEQERLDASHLSAVLFLAPQVVGKLVDVRDPEHLAPLPHHRPDRHRVINHLGRVLDSGKGVGVGHVQPAVLRQELPDAATVEGEEIDDLLQSLFDLQIHVAYGHMDEGGREVGEEGLELQAFFQGRILRPLLRDVPYYDPCPQQRPIPGL